MEIASNTQYGTAAPASNVSSCPNASALVKSWHTAHKTQEHPRASEHVHGLHVNHGWSNSTEPEV